LIFIIFVVQAMSWLRAVWKEGHDEVEDVLPSVWLQGSSVRWPRTGKAEKLRNDRAEPDSSWHTFPLVKVKFTHGKIHHRVDSRRITSGVVSPPRHSDRSPFNENNAKIKKVKLDFQNLNCFRYLF